MVGGEQISILPMGWLVIQGLSGTPQTRPGPLDTGGY